MEASWDLAAVAVIKVVVVVAWLDAAAGLRSWRGDDLAELP